MPTSENSEQTKSLLTIFHVAYRDLASGKMGGAHRRHLYLLSAVEKPQHELIQFSPYNARYFE
jgi:hypothetical protein